MKHWNHLPAFAAVMVEGSFTKAAKRMGLTPAALSQNIAQLERTMGARLFHRTTRQIHPTDEARILFDSIGDIVVELDERLRGTQLQKNSMAGTIKMSLSPAYGRSKILPIIAKFLHKFPTIIMDIDFDNSLESPARTGVDVAIRHGLIHEGYIARVLTEMKPLLVASPAYIQAKGVPHSPQELSNHTLIMGRMPDSRIIKWNVFAKGKEQSILRSDPSAFAIGRNPSVIISGQMDAVRDAALSGMGVAAIFDDYVQDDINNGRLQRILPEYEVDLGADDISKVFIEYPSKIMISNKVRSLIDFIIYEVSDNGGR